MVKIILLHLPERQFIKSIRNCQQMKQTKADSLSSNKYYLNNSKPFFSIASFDKGL